MRIVFFLLSGARDGWGGGGLQVFPAESPRFRYGLVRPWCEKSRTDVACVTSSTTPGLFVPPHGRGRSSSSNDQYLAPRGALLCRDGRSLRFRHDNVTTEETVRIVSQIKFRCGGGVIGLVGRDEEGCVLCTCFVPICVTTLKCVRCLCFIFCLLLRAFVCDVSLLPTHVSAFSSAGGGARSDLKT